ncbi:MAG: protein kinase [Sandaracinaceae bacterium]
MELASGQVIGEKYRLQQPIGEGGMATVWGALHVTLGRPVAIKFLQAVGAHAKQMSERFVREAQICAGLRHRNVVDIVDFGVTEDGQPYMVMEYLAGRSLADRYTNGPPLTDWDVLEIAAMTLSGLAAVHDAGIIHRDIKPENIFLSEDADGTVPKLIDFGVSRGFTEGQRITRTGAVIGTPEYMSPEQARGVKDIGPGTDIWSVGIVLFEGFTGRLPFESENPGDVLIQVATEEVPPLGAARPDLPREVTDIVTRALQRDPAERFYDARAMRDAILDVLQSQLPLRGRPSSSILSNAYGPAAGSGKLKALSVRPDAPAVTAIELTAPRQSPTPRATRPSETGPIETEKLRPRPAPKRSNAWVVWALLMASIAIGIGAFVALDGVGELRRRGLLGDDDMADIGARGAVRPGQDVAAFGEPSDLEEEPLDVAPIAAPPTDGEPAPSTETIDVPSPPDPPDVEAPVDP